MPIFLRADLIKDAVSRLGDSRASKSMVHFLVFKRARVRANHDVVSFSQKNDDLGGAVDELTRLFPVGVGLSRSLRDKPHFNPFGSAGSTWQYLGSNWRENGTGPTLSGATWKGIVDVVSERPRSGKLSTEYVSKLPKVLLKRGDRLPVLMDAAIWYHRAQDLTPLLNGISDPTELETALCDVFIRELGLTEDEIAAIFDRDTHPLAGQERNAVLSDQVADPLEYLPDRDAFSTEVGDLSALLNAFETDANDPAVGLRVARPVLLRFLAALTAKPFLILGGLSGSGKTRLAQALAHWLTPPAEEGDAAYALIPVGADWTGSDSIMGYPDGIDPTRYVTRPALDLIQRAMQPERRDEPHFLILDEMNLSHVERYFADLLSLIESGESLELYRPQLDTGGVEQLRSGVVPRLSLPSNLFIVGTVNVDESTYMFSPKVLDRANVIEFRMDRDELVAFLAAPAKPVIESLDGLGTHFGAVFVQAASQSPDIPAAVKDRFQSELLLFFDLMRDHGGEFGFRVAHEAARFLHCYRLFGGYADDQTSWFHAAMDAVILQKLLPKLHGSRPRLEGLLWALAWACGADRAGLDLPALLVRCREAGLARDESTLGPEAVERAVVGQGARYPLSFDKVLRLWRKLVRDQFVTFSEA